MTLSQRKKARRRRTKARRKRRRKVKPCTRKTLWLLDEPANVAWQELLRDSYWESVFREAGLRE